MPANTVAIVEDFLAECETKFSGVSRATIYAMDQTAIRLDAPLYATYAVRGTKKVGATTTNNTRTKISAAYTCDGNGRKLPIFCIVPRKTPLPGYEPPENISLEYKTSGTFDSAMICKYITR